MPNWDTTKFRTLYTETGQSITVNTSDVSYILSESPEKRFTRCPLCMKVKKPWYAWHKETNKGWHKDSGPCPTLKMKRGDCPICVRNNVSRPIYGRTDEEVGMRRDEHMLAYHRQEAINEFGIPDKPREWHNIYIVVPKPVPPATTTVPIQRPLTTTERLIQFLRNAIEWVI